MRKIITIIAILVVVDIFLNPGDYRENLEAISAVALIFTAIFVSLQAWSTKKLADSTVKKEIIKAEIGDLCIKKLDQKISQDIFDSYDFASMSEISKSEMEERYKNFKEPIKFYMINFKITNTSNFTWKKPTFTYEIPISQRYLVLDHPNRVIIEHLPHTNYRMMPPSEKKYHFLSGDTDIFTLINLPYINSERHLMIQLTLSLDPEMEEFTIDMSVNCENAEGITKPIKIKPRELLEKFKSSPK